VAFVMNKITLGHIYLHVLLFPLAILHSTDVPYSHINTFEECYRPTSRHMKIPNRSWASLLIWHLAELIKILFY